MHSVFSNSVFSLACALVMLGFMAFRADAYPEFQKHIQENSGRNVNCALCHAHPDGPDGLKSGQIGSLSQEELSALNKARSAFEPGQEVDSPILNPFGNRIIHDLGKTRFLQLRPNPAELATVLDNTVDIDADGIADTEEYLAGTHPVDPNHGDPWTLFKVNIQNNFFHIVMILVATILGVWGLGNVLHGFDIVFHEKEVEVSGEK